MVSRETRTTPKTDRLPRDFDPTAKAINTILDNMTWEEAQDYGQRGLQAGWDKLRSGTGTLQDALNTPIEDVDWYDAARGLGTGVRQGLEGFASLPGAAVRISDILRDALAQRMGFSADQSAAFGQGMDRLMPLAPALRDTDIEGLSKEYIGDYYQPKTPLGKTMEFGGSMVDPMTAVPGGLGYKIARRMF